MLNKKAQIGDTLTWVVATIIIFVILFFFIFGSSILGKTKDVTNFRQSLFSKEGFDAPDAFLTKNIFTYLLFENSKDGNSLFKKLNAMDENGEFEDSLELRLAELKTRAEGK